MKSNDEVLKNIHIVIDSVKDTVEADLISLQSSGRLKVDKTILPELIQLVQMSIDNGYQKSCMHAAKSVMTVFEKMLAAAATIGESDVDQTFKSRRKR